MEGVTLYTFSQTRVCYKYGTILVFETVVLLFFIIENFGMQSCCITKCCGGRKRGTDLVIILDYPMAILRYGQETGLEIIKLHPYVS
jgi:hypothetical protein